MSRSGSTFHRQHYEERLECDVVADGSRVAFRFTYDPVLVDACRKIFKSSQGYYAPDVKRWIVPITASSSVLRSLSELDPQCFVASSLRSMIETSARMPIRVFGKRLGATIHPVVNGGSALISSYDPVLIRTMHGIAARWHTEQKYWVSRLEPADLKEIIVRDASIAAEHVYIGENPVELIEHQRQTAEHTIDVGRSAPALNEIDDQTSGKRYLLTIAEPLAKKEVDRDAVAAFATKYSLYPHQAEAAAHLLQYSGSLLADDMGLGKTRSAAIGARILGSQTVVLCPASLKLNWKREIMFCGEASGAIGIIEGSREPVRKAQWLILNYENLDVLLKRGDVRDFTLIIDEAHYIKEPRALRTRKAFELAARAKRRFLLTATPILNHPEEIYTLLKLSGHPGAEISFVEFAELYTTSSEARRLLADRIKEWILRRRKDDVISLPEKVRSTPEIEVPQELREEYAEIFDDDSMIPLAKLTRLRQSLERMKVPFIIESAESTPPESKAVIFCQYKESVAKIAGQFGPSAVRFTGDETLKQRDASISAFQHGSAKFFVSTMEAGGVGINLTEASYVLFASRPLTPSVQFQAEDRCHRIGQGKRLEVIVPTVAGTIDEDIQRLLEEKQTMIEEVLTARLGARSDRSGASRPRGLKLLSPSPSE